MRTVNANILAAISDTVGYKMYARGVIEPSRMYSNVLTYNYPVADADPGGIFEYMPQGYAVSTGTSGTYGAFVFGIMSHAYGLRILRFGSSGESADITYSSTPLDIKGGSQPGIVDGHLFYVDNSDGYPKHATLDMNAVYNKTAACVTALETIEASSTAGAMHGIDSTRCVRITSDGFGSHVVYYYYSGGTWNKSEWGERFVFPTIPQTSNLYACWSGAVKFGNDIIAYITNPDGSVTGVKRDGTNGVWGRSFTAVPADMSQFWVANAFVANGKVFLCGQFRRMKDSGSGKLIPDSNSQVYNMLLFSNDGINFSMDWTTLYSRQGYAFKCCADSTNLYAFQQGREIQIAGNYQLLASPTTLAIASSAIIAVDISSRNNGGQATIKLAEGSETYEGSTLLKKGNRFKLYLGYNTTGGSEDILYDTYIIDQIAWGYGDGKRNLSLSLISEGLWRTTNQTAPYYTEILSKSGVLDDCKELDNFYPAPNQGMLWETLSVDFWGAEAYAYDDTCTALDVTEGGGVKSVVLTSNQKVSFKCVDLVASGISVNYPKVATLPFTVSIYAWSDGDPTNCTFAPFIIKRDASGNNEVVAGGTTYFTLTSSPARPANTEPSYVAGSFPITYNSNYGWSVGDQIISVGLIVTAPANSSRFYISRVDISNMTIIEGFDQQDTSWTLLDDGEGLEVSKPGIPYDMFSVKPYNPLNFELVGEFNYIEGDTAPTGYFEWGLIGLAEDAQNYVAGLYSPIGSGTLAIVYCRNGKRPSPGYLAYTTFSKANLQSPQKMKFTHHDGYFTLSMQNADGTWPNPPNVTYTWASANGPMATNIDNLHVGIHCWIKPPGFHIVGLDSAEGGNIALLPGYYTSDFDSFSAGGGRCVIDGLEYTYTGKTGTSFKRGPFQGLGSDSWTYGPWKDLDCLDMAWHYKDNAEDYTGYIIANDNGLSWVAAATEAWWSPWVMVDAAQVDQPDRSRWRADDCGFSAVGQGDRCYVTAGLTGVKRDHETDLKHLMRSMVFIHNTSKLQCKSFSAIAGGDEMTLADMIVKVCAASGVQASFPGDYFDDSIALSSGVEYDLG